MLAKNRILYMQDVPYRILHFERLTSEIVVIEMNTERLHILNCDASVEILPKLESKEFFVEEDTELSIAVLPMSAECQERFERNKQIVAEINFHYGQSHYLGLKGKEQKPPLLEIQNKYGIGKKTLRIIITRYLQSGCKESSLIDRRAQNYRRTPKQYEYVNGHRPGAKAEQNTSKIVRDEHLCKCFDEIIKMKLDSRYATYSKCFGEVIQREYSVGRRDEETRKIILSDEEIQNAPTLKQFYQYKKRHVTYKQEYIAGHSKQEYQNNKRPLFSDCTIDAYGVGDSTQVDIVDMDLLLTRLDMPVIAGRPHVYFLTDVISRIIMAYFISYANNSLVGLQGLLINLAQDKVELCKRFGIPIHEWQWPSNIIPGSMFCDNGSDFESNRIMEIYQRLGIERNLVPPAMGSYKPIVERKNKSLNDFFKTIFEDLGVIGKHYGSTHYDDAKLNMILAEKIVILFILNNNEHYMEEYPTTREMLDNNIKPIPYKIWEFQSKIFPYRKILNKKEFIQNCLFDGEASITREGIEFQKHVYFPDAKDIQFWKDMDNFKKRIKIPVRYSLADADFILYLRGSVYYTATLSTLKSDERTFGSIDRITLEEYDKKKEGMDTWGESYNRVVDAEYASHLKKIADDVRNNPKASKDNIRQNLSEEKTSDLKRKSPFPDIIDGEESKTEESPIPLNDKENDAKEIVSSGWEAAMENFSL